MSIAALSEKQHNSLLAEVLLLRAAKGRQRVTREHATVLWACKLGLSADEIWSVIGEEFKGSGGRSRFEDTHRWAQAKARSS